MPGIAILVIVVMAPSGGEVSLAKTAHPEVQQIDNEVIPSSMGKNKRLPEVAKIDLELLAGLRPQPRPVASAAADGGRAAKISNVFTATSWYVPPPPPPPLPAAPPPVQSAPPLPFTYLGRYEDAPTLLAILVKGERMYTVAVGDVIEDTYRIERVTAGQVELTYLPLNIKQSLNTGEAL